MSADFVAVLLAAGGSQRLGHSKQLLRREGQTLLRHAAHLACGSGAARVLVALGAQRERLQAELCDLPVEIVDVPNWQEGLGASLARLQQALRTAQYGHVLVLGCDQPALAAPHLQQLLAAAARSDGSAFSGYAGVRGLPAVVAWPLWRQARFAGDVGLRDVARSGAHAVAVVEAPELALDLDTAADVSAAVSLGWLDRPG